MIDLPKASEPQMFIFQRSIWRRDHSCSPPTRGEVGGFGAEDFQLGHGTSLRRWAPGFGWEEWR